MRVLVLTNMFPTAAEPWFGVFVSDQTADLQNAGVDVEVLAFDARSSRRAYLTAARRLRHALRDGCFDIVHAHYGLAGAVAATQRRVPVVTTFHGSDALARSERPISWVVARRTRPIAVAPVVADSLGLRDAAVIPCAVDTELFALVDRAQARRLLGWPADGRLRAVSRRTPRPVEAAEAGRSVRRGRAACASASTGASAPSAWTGCPAPRSRPP